MQGGGEGRRGDEESESVTSVNFFLKTGQVQELVLLCCKSAVSRAWPITVAPCSINKSSHC
jgi:hypothetical protein